MAVSHTRSEPLQVPGLAVLQLTRDALDIARYGDPQAASTFKAALYRVFAALTERDRDNAVTACRQLARDARNGVRPGHCAGCLTPGLCDLSYSHLRPCATGALTDPTSRLACPSRARQGSETREGLVTPPGTSHRETAGA